MPGQIPKARVKKRENNLKAKQDKDLNGSSLSVSTGSNEGTSLIDKNPKSKQSNKEKMLKSGASQDEKKKDEKGSDNPSDTVTRLTRNRLLQHQRQKISADGSDAQKSNKDNTKTKAKEGNNDKVKDGPSSLSDSVKKESNIKPEPQLSDKKKTEDKVSALKSKREKEKKTIVDSKDDQNEKKGTFVMKTRSGRSSQPVINMSAVNQQNKADENVKKKKTNFSYRRSKKMYDEAGALITNGKDYCDCLETDCPGCHFPCKKCGSEKCGTECRCERNWVYDEVKIEGTGITVKNHAC